MIHMITCLCHYMTSSGVQSSIVPCHNLSFLLKSNCSYMLRFEILLQISVRKPKWLLPGECFLEENRGYEKKRGEAVHFSHSHECLIQKSTMSSALWFFKGPSLHLDL